MRIEWLPKKKSDIQKDGDVLNQMKQNLFLLKSRL